MELKSKRTLNSKHFLLEDGKIKGNFHVGHIHYNDKLGGTGLRSIDWTLSFDEVKRGWGFQYHSFHPFLPEYADGWVEFRDLFDDKDQTIKYKAHASHVLGRLVQPSEIGLEKETSVNCVIYDGAFGEGKDYILYFTRSALKKVVRIREEFKGTEEQRFTWDVDFPKENDVTKKVKRVKNKDEYELDITQDKTFDSDRITKIGNDKGDGKEWHTYLRTFKAWDSGELDDFHSETINVEYSANDKTITKIIPALFLTKSVGDVFTDTTTSYYVGSGDGAVEIVNTSTGWSTIHNRASGDYANYTNNYLAINRFLGVLRDSSTRHDPTRAFLPIDTSAIPDTDIISSAKMYLCSTGNGSVGEDTGYAWFAIVETTQDDTSKVVVGDFSRCGSATNPTLLSDTINISSTTTDDYSEYTLNANGISAINKAGISKFGVRSGDDMQETDPFTLLSVSNGNNVYSSETAGTDKDPYLSVTYGTGATPSGSLGLLGCGM